MNKLILTASIAALLASGSALAAKNNDIYVTVPVGYSFAMKAKKGEDYTGKMKNSFLFGIGLGYDYDMFRPEINLTFRNGYKYSGSIGPVGESQKFKTTTVMLNVYKDLDIVS